MNEMAREIEKKYLIRENGVEHITETFLQLYSSVDSLKDDALTSGKTIRQGYMSIEKGKKLAAQKLGIDVDFNPGKARLRENVGAFYFTLKGKGGISRNEIESEVSHELFEMYWPDTEGKRVEKVRLEAPYEGYVLEIDVYTDDRDLIVAEVELPTIKAAERLKPVGLDITDNKDYKNRNLAK